MTVLAAIAAGYFTLAGLIAWALSRMARAAARTPEPVEQPEWSCPDTLADLERELTS